MRAGHGPGPPAAPKLQDSRRRGDLGSVTLICSLRQASSFTVQMGIFQGHVCTGPAGVRVRVCPRAC